MQLKQIFQNLYEITRLSSKTSEPLKTSVAIFKKIVITDVSMSKETKPHINVTAHALTFYDMDSIKVGNIW